MKQLDIKSLLITEKNLSYLKEKDDNSFNIKKLLGVNLTQSQANRFGNMFQNFIKDVKINQIIN